MVDIQNQRLLRTSMFFKAFLQFGEHLLTDQMKNGKLENEDSSIYTG